MAGDRGLIIFPGALGDLICLQPAIRALCRRRSTIQFELMARAELARFAIQRMGIVGGHSIDRREVAVLFSASGGESDLARKFFSQFGDIECFFASDNPTFCASLSKTTQGEVRFYPFRPPGTGHIAESYLRVIGADIPDPLDGSIELAPNDLLDAKHKLGLLRLEPGRFVLLFPGSGSIQKNWPARYFAQLLERIQLLYPSLVVLGAAEAQLMPIFQVIPLQILSNPELAEVAGISRLARCFVSNDSGVAHLAAAAGARGLVIFGPTAPDRWRPLGNVMIMRKQPLASLTSAEVWPNVEQLIKAGD
jgi:ADP-heptose:LPS heptosyltransferase